MSKPLLSLDVARKCRVKTTPAVEEKDATDVVIRSFRILTPADGLASISAVVVWRDADGNDLDAKRMHLLGVQPQLDAALEQLQRRVLSALQTAGKLSAGSVS